MTWGYADFLESLDETESYDRDMEESREMLRPELTPEARERIRADLAETRAAIAYVNALDWVHGPFRGWRTADQRDLTPEPPGYLDPGSVLHMRKMLKDATANGDRPWPYIKGVA